MAIQNEVLQFTWNSVALSDVGSVRSENEDAYLLLPDQGLWLVADGMGGHAFGELASQKIVESILSISSAVRLAQLTYDVQERLQFVNRWLLTEASERKLGIIGSTVAVLLTLGRYCVCIWAGDSRVYRYRRGQLLRLTRDHRRIEELIAGQALSRNNAENNSYSWANQLTRAVGASEKLELAAELREVLPGDRYLLCSDGLYEEISDDQISDLMELPDLNEACISLVKSANEKGGHDNITVVLVEAETGL